MEISGPLLLLPTRIDLTSAYLDTSAAFGRPGLNRSASNRQNQVTRLLPRVVAAACSGRMTAFATMLRPLPVRAY
jgi:hypothetical protein